MFTWMGIYTGFLILAGRLSTMTDHTELIHAVGEIIFITVVLTVLKKKRKLFYYGIRSLRELNYSKLLYCMPMVLLCTVNLWLGISVKDEPARVMLECIWMACVGFSEELLFRSFLIRAVSRKNERIAILLSGCIFGIVHLFNLIGGADAGETLIQVLYACSLGLMFAMFFVRTGNIIPCMITHSLIDITSVFGNPATPTAQDEAVYAVMIVIPLLYAWYVWKKQSEGFQ